VEAHGGTVTAESDGPDRGATFRVELPLLASHPAAADEATPVLVGTEQTLAGVRALVVDDEADARELSRYVLERRGAIVAAAGSCGEALHLLSTSDYDVLVADIGMPGQDGIALIRAVRGLPASSPNREIQAIALTAYTGSRERQEALAAGFDVHLE
jgi:CheY-like chemotaxis protein